MDEACGDLLRAALVSQPGLLLDSKDLVPGGSEDEPLWRHVRVRLRALCSCLVET